MYAAGAKISALDSGVVAELRSCARTDDAARLNQIAAVGKFQALLRVLLHEEHADAGLADTAERRE
jgi:hypothetical protein